MGRKRKPNEYEIRGNVAYLTLTNRSGAEVAKALIDVSDLDRVLSQPRCYCGNENYVMLGYTGIKLHRFLLNAPDGMQVDHINGDRLDNRRSNTRLCTAGENNMNRRYSQPLGRSGVRNVVWDPRAHKWFVKVRARGVQYLGGYFNNLEDAAEAAQRLRRQAHGAFAVGD